MNKKIKISLLGVLLTSSLAGVATTIASCSASAIPELTIEKNPNLITELDKVLTESLAAMKDDNLKKQEFNRWINNNELPQSAKDVISQNIVFKNGSKAVPFNDVFDKLVVSNLSGFPQNPATPIPAIDIEIKIKEGPFSIASGSTSLLKFTTGTLGKLNPVQISGISYDVITYDEIKEKINTKLNEAMDAAITYQDKFTLYSQWTQGTNFPVAIGDFLRNNVSFRTSSGILSWNAVFDTFAITLTGEYPSTSNTKIPNMTLNTKLKSGYLIAPDLLDEKLKFSDIPFTSETGKIKLDVGFKDSILAALGSELSKDLSLAATYQERKMIFNNWNNSEGAMKPDSISPGAREVILSNLALTTFGYNSPLTLDDFISKISIVPVTAGDIYPNDLIANLPPMKLVLVLDDHKFVNPNSNYQFSINLPPLTADSGVGEFTFDIPNTLDTLQKNMTDLFTNELNGDYASNKAKYESWTSYNSFPMPVRNALAAGISFKTTIDIPNISLYSNMIDFEKTEMIKRPFPETVGAQIMPMEIKFVLKPGRAVRIDGSLTNVLPKILILNLPEAGSTIYQFAPGGIAKVLEFVHLIQKSISELETFEAKKDAYNEYISFEKLPIHAIATLKNTPFEDMVSPGPNKTFADLVEIVPAFSKDGPFPPISGEPIPTIRLEFKFIPNVSFKYNSVITKRFPITINFSGITS